MKDERDSFPHRRLTNKYTKKKKTEKKKEEHEGRSNADVILFSEWS